MTTIRDEKPEDAPAVHAVEAAAFEREEEATLVDALRASGSLALSLVAEASGCVVGHVAFSPVSVECEENGTFRALGLGPLAVAPDSRRRGVGGALVRAGLDRCRADGYELVFVLGDPRYYARFGFVPAADYGLRWERMPPDPVFQVLLLKPGVLTHAPTGPGLVRYAPEFDAV